jgi:glycosyltransferase involved in cell wall biosynthesis
MEHFSDEKLLSTLQAIKKIKTKFFLCIVPNPSSLPYLLYRYKLMREGNWLYGKEYLRYDYEFFLEKAGFYLLKQYLFGWNFTKYFIERITNDNTSNLYFNEMVDNRLISANEAYLIGYLSCIEENDITNMDIKNITPVQNNDYCHTEERTMKFDSIAEFNRIKNIVEDKESEINTLQDKVAELEISYKTQLQDNKSLHTQLEQKESLLNFWTMRVAAMETSKFWKIRTVWFKLKPLLGFSTDDKPGLLFLLNKVFKIYKNEGIENLIRRVSNKYTKIQKQIDINNSEDIYKLQINSILQTNQSAQGIISYLYSIDWNTPLYQRPHHLAVQLSKLGYLFFYPTYNATYDNYDGFIELQQNLTVTNQLEILIEKLTKTEFKNKLFLVTSTQMSYNIQDLINLKNNGFKIIYEYIDEIDSAISGCDVNYQLDRHNCLDLNSVDFVLATATKLYEEMITKFPKEKVIYHPNAVDYEHFHIEKDPAKCPKIIQSILAEGKPIIGYYGALADWIDYDLINSVARKRVDWNIVLIGLDYDKSMKKLERLDNIKYLGVKKYQDLPNYGIWFDVAIIPFKEGDIAKSTSPLKLFEYMAMNKPVVATRDLIECQKYEGVLMAEDKNDFILKVEQALDLKDDPNYLLILDENAKSNTWLQRAMKIDELIQNNLVNYPEK